MHIKDFRILSSDSANPLLSSNLVLKDCVYIVLIYLIQNPSDSLISSDKVFLYSQSRRRYYRIWGQLFEARSALNSLA